MNQGENYIYVGQIKIDMKILTQGGNMLGQNHDLVVVLSRPFTVDAAPRISDMTIGAVTMSTPALIPPNEEHIRPVPSGSRPPEPIPPVPPEPIPPEPPRVVSP